MNRNRSIVAVLAMTAVAATGCARNAPVPDPGGGAAPDSAFCKSVKDYRHNTLVLNNGPALAANPTAARAQIDAARTALSAMKSETPDAPQTAADLQTIADTDARISANLASVKAGDLLAYTHAVSAALLPDPKKVADASGRLDVYIRLQCGLTTSPNLATTTTNVTPTSAPPASTTTSAPANTVGPVGPTGPAVATTVSAAVTTTSAGTTSTSG